MTLLLSSTDVQSLITMKESVDCVERYFLSVGNQTSENYPRLHIGSEDLTLDLMPAALNYLGRLGCKIGKKKSTFFSVLFDRNDGKLLAIMNASEFGRYRTGAASAVATKYLTGFRSFRLGVAGTGKQAITQITAQMEIANLEKVTVWSPHKERRETFARNVSRKLGIDCVASSTLNDAFGKADVGTTITSSISPFVTKRAVEHLAHLNSCGATLQNRSEIFVKALSHFQCFCVDNLKQARMEAQELILAARENQKPFEWKYAIELKDVVQGKVRRPRGNTYFRSLGIGAEDVAMAAMLFDKASKTRTFVRSYFDFDK